MERDDTDGELPITGTADLGPEDRALRKLRGFMLDLDDEERTAMARLIAPGVEKALADDSVHEWTPDAVQRWLKGADGQRRGYSSD